MIEILKREIIYIWYYFSIQFSQIFFYWLVGILIGSLISVFGKNKIYSLFSVLRRKSLGILGIMIASVIGIISPLCMYGTIPIAASLSEKGMKDDLLASFMMASILLNPQLLIYSAVLGHKVLIIRLISCFICGVSAGILVKIFFSNKSFFNFSRFSEISNRDTDPNIIIRLIKNIGRNIKATGPYFLIGVLLSALFQRYVPPDVFASLFGRRRGFGILIAATMGVPLYACGGGTIPLLLGWLQSGMSLGSAAAFMITGPATKITNLGAVKIILGIKHFIFYLAFTILFAIFTGFIVDSFL